MVELSKTTVQEDKRDIVMMLLAQAKHSRTLVAFWRYPRLVKKMNEMIEYLEKWSKEFLEESNDGAH